MSKTKIIDKILDGLTYLGLILITLSVLLPLSWIVLSSMQVGNSLYSSSFFPKSLTLDHYRTLFRETDFPIWYMNTLKIATLNMILGVIITTLTAYTFSRYKFRGRKQAMIAMLVLQMFPSFLAMTAIYILITKMGLMDTHAGLLMVYIAGQIPYNSWLVKGYFDGIPKSLDESARVDGAGHLTIFLKIILPITKPIVVFIALTNFIGPWFDFIFPKLLLRSAEKKTLAVGIFEWISTRANDNFTQFAAASILIAVPIALLFMYLQKHIVAGLAAGATKG
jgi:arabinogalactan oligomer/maltooligosaccharide transport system permease protein